MSRYTLLIAEGFPCKNFHVIFMILISEFIISELFGYLGIGQLFDVFKCDLDSQFRYQKSWCPCTIHVEESDDQYKFNLFECT